MGACVLVASDATDMWSAARRCAISKGMSIGPCDPRSVANLLLDIADEQGLTMTHLALQKLLYFAHAMFLIETGTPLVSGYFEAWTYGPVHPAVYRAFQGTGHDPIETRATRVDLVTGESSQVPIPTSEAIRTRCVRIMAQYAPLTPGRLVDISHARNGPWDVIVNKATTSVALGLRIPDNIIAKHFRHHKVPVSAEPLSGEPSEDTPLTRD